MVSLDESLTVVRSSVLLTTYFARARVNVSTPNGVRDDLPSVFLFGRPRRSTYHAAIDFA